MVNPSQKKEEKRTGGKPKIDQANADPAEDEHVYVIDSLNFGEPVYDLESDSEWLLEKRRERQMADKENRTNCTKRECKVLYNFLNPMEHAKYKTSHYSPIL